MSDAISALSPELLAQIAAAVRAYDTPAVIETPGSDVPTVMAAPGSKLDQLSAQYAAVKPQLDALTKQMKDITDQLKVELMVAQQGAPTVLLRGPSLERPLKLNSYNRITVSGKDLKAASPALYARLAKTTTVWTLQAVNG